MSRLAKVHKHGNSDNAKDVTLSPSTKNISKVRSAVRLVNSYFQISLKDIWDCETLKGFNKLLKDKYYLEARKFHPDLKKHTTYERRHENHNIYVDGKIHFGRMNKLSCAYHDARELNERDFKVILGMKSVPDPELPFICTWDRDIHLPSGFHEDMDHLKYR